MNPTKTPPGVEQATTLTTGFYTSDRVNPTKTPPGIKQIRLPDTFAGAEVVNLAEH